MVEFKSASAYGSKLAKEAPKREHVAQAGLYARGLGANAIHIVYVAKESSFRDKVRAGDVYEHYFELGDTVFDDESVNEVVEFELIRFRRVEAALNENVLPYPVVYDESYGDNNWSRLKTVEEPGPYGVGSKKLHWECRYCLYNGLCHGVGPDEVQL